MAEQTNDEGPIFTDHRGLDGSSPATAPLYAIPARLLASPETRQMSESYSKMVQYQAPDRKQPRNSSPPVRNRSSCGPPNTRPAMRFIPTTTRLGSRADATSACCIARASSIKNGTASTIPAAD
jgi:hypothetical protein